jgi:hypothetical protein
VERDATRTIADAGAADRAGEARVVRSVDAPSGVRALAVRVTGGRR